MTAEIVAIEDPRSRVLFVEDEGSLREHLVDALSDEFVMDSACNGTEALQLVLRCRPDVVVTDVVMPDIGGIELLRTLRNTPSTEMIPVLLISGHMREDIRLEGFKEGADGYLSKPYTIRELRTRIRSILQNSRARAEVARREATQAAEQQATLEMAALLESITDPFYALDRQWRFTYANQLALDYFGRRREGIIGRTLWDLCPELRNSVFESELRRGLASRSSVTFEALSPFSAQWLDVHAYPTPSGLAVSFRDITERKRAEEAVRQANQTLGTLVHSCPLAIIVVDPDPPIVRLWNPAAEKLFGWRQADVVGKSLPIISEETSTECRILRQTVSSGRSLANLETWRRRRDGSRAEVNLSAAPLRDASQAVNAVLLLYSDVTERKRAEQRVRQSEQFLRLVLDCVPQKIFTARPDGNIDYFNPQWTAFTGLSFEQIRDWGWTQFVHPDDVGASIRGWRNALQKETAFQTEHRFRRADGQYRWHIGRAVPLKSVDGKVELWVGANTEIHDLKRAEEETQRRSDQVRRLAAVAQQLSTVPDVATALPLVAEQARVLIGAHVSVTTFAVDESSSNVVYARSLSEKYAAFRHEEYSQRVSAIALRAGGPLRLGQSELASHPDLQGSDIAGPGNTSLRGLLSAPLLGRDGRHLGVILLSDRCEGDFTEDDEGVLVQLAQMAAVAIENARLVEDLRETDRKKDEFLSILAHELRNPLAPIRNGLQILRSTAAVDVRRQSTLTMMDRQMTHLVRLVDDLLDIGRITRGKLELRTERLRLRDVLATAVEASRAVLEAHEHQLTVEQRADIVVEGDANRLAQVFANLLSNSAKYTDRAGRVSIVVEQDGADAVIRVQDNGIGIPPDSLEQVFDLFSQVRVHQSRADGGLGIGLALVRRLLTMHGGSVTAFSEGPGRGSTFTVRLPIIEPSQLDAAKPDLPPTIENRRRILVVDDNADAAASLAGMLEMAGHEVRTAGDGVEAVDASSEFEPDVIFMDIGMPRMDGLEATRRIRSTAPGQNMLIVALTGWGQQSDRQRTREAGMDVHLVKPVSPEALLDVLARSATGSRASLQ